MPAIELTMPSGCAGGGERRALLDVRLDEARGRAARASRPAAARRSRARRRPRRARCRRRRRGRPRRPRAAADGAAAEHAAPEARALLEPAGDDLDACARGRPSAAIASAASSASSTPSAPSKRPPSGGVSRCEPLHTSGRSGSLPASRPTSVGGRVARRLEPRLAHPAEHELVRAAPPRRRSRGGWCRRPGRSRRACRAARGCAPRATPGSRRASRPGSRLAACSPARVCQQAGCSCALWRFSGPSLDDAALSD